MPSLKQLLGQRLQALWINGGFNRAIHSLNIELLSHTQADYFFHLAILKIDKTIMQTASKRIVSFETKKTAMCDLQNAKWRQLRRALDEIVIIDTQSTNSVSAHLHQI